MKLYEGTEVVGMIFWTLTRFLAIGTNLQKRKKIRFCQQFVKFVLVTCKINVNKTDSLGKFNG